MSEADLYMPDTNQSFDLPRWQTHVDPLSSTAQAAHGAHSAYHYNGPPPPPPQSNPAASPQRLQQIHHSSTTSARHRISQLIDDQQPPLASPYLSSPHNQLARSASLTGGHASNTPSRARRHHQPEDLEGAFNIDPQSRQSGQLLQTPFYPQSAPYQQQSLTGPSSLANSASSPADSFSDMYYNSSTTQPSKRVPPLHDPGSSTRAGRSPFRGPPTAGPGLDSFSQQSQYSPTTGPYSYGPTTDQRAHPPYHSHSRNHSQVKPSDSMTPPPYTPQTASLSAAGPYPASYTMETSSSHPPTQIQTHLAPHAAVRQNSSNPPTPLSYMQTQSPASQYYSQEQAMVVDAPPPRRRASGFRRVRTLHDLQPRLDVPPTGRRMGSDGVFLSVSMSRTHSYKD